MTDTLRGLVFPQISPVREIVQSPTPSTPQQTSPLDQRIEVFVLSNPRKQSVTVETLTALGIPYTLYSNPDWDLPKDHPEWQISREARPQVRGYAVRQYRAFKGHQEILRQANPDKYTLVFEDDASLMPDTTPDEVLKHLNAAPEFLGWYDAVSFHARKQSPPEMSMARYAREYIELAKKQLRGQEDWGHVFFLKPAINSYDGKYHDLQFRWHEGCLVYMVNQRGREKWLAAGHGSGLPCDLFLANELHTIVMRHTIFHHDQKYGSLISNTVKQ